MFGLRRQPPFQVFDAGFDMPEPALYGIEPPVVLVEPQVVLVEPPVVRVEAPVMLFQLRIDRIETQNNRVAEVNERFEEFAVRRVLRHESTIAYSAAAWPFHEKGGAFLHRPFVIMSLVEGYRSSGLMPR